MERELSHRFRCPAWRSPRSGYAVRIQPISDRLQGHTCFALRLYPLRGRIRRFLGPAQHLPLLSFDLQSFLCPLSYQPSLELRESREYVRDCLARRRGRIDRSI